MGRGFGGRGVPDRAGPVGRRIFLNKGLTREMQKIATKKGSPNKETNFLVKPLLGNGCPASDPLDP